MEGGWKTVGVGWGILYNRGSMGASRRELDHVLGIVLGTGGDVGGVILLLERLDVIEGGLSDYWPVLLIAVGVAMVGNWWRRRD